MGDSIEHRRCILVGGGGKMEIGEEIYRKKPAFVLVRASLLVLVR